jgi:hypothetical protein
MTQTVRVCSHVFGPLVVRHDARLLTPRPRTLLQSHWAVELAEKARSWSICDVRD